MTFRSLLIALACLASPVAAQNIEFGGDTSEYANDGECDDRRFYGAGMATVLTWDNVGQDASDCRAALEAGIIKVWDFQAAKAATQCSAIDFGDDSGGYPNDGECDDRRFEGLASAHVILADDVRRDASDCITLCAYGVIALREY